MWWITPSWPCILYCAKRHLYSELWTVFDGLSKAGPFKRRINMEHIVFTCRLFIVHVPVVFARDTFLVHEQLKMNQTGPLQSEKKTICTTLFISLWLFLFLFGSTILQTHTRWLRAADPHSFFADLDTAVFQCGSGSNCFSIVDPDPALTVLKKITLWRVCCSCKNEKQKDGSNV